jgi:hypothetical protein
MATLYLRYTEVFVRGPDLGQVVLAVVALSPSVKKPAVDADVCYRRGGEDAGDFVAVLAELHHRSLRTALSEVIRGRNEEVAKHMSGGQRTDSKLCWNCGELGRFVAGIQIYCSNCDVSWTPGPPLSMINLDKTIWEGALIDCVDFTKPGALSCPA